MSFKDFTKYWDQIEICNLSPDALDEDVPVKWEVASFTGEWIAGASAGGCRNFVETFAKNPQFIITLEVFFPFFCQCTRTTPSSPPLPILLLLESE